MESREFLGKHIYLPPFCSYESPQPFITTNGLQMLLCKNERAQENNKSIRKYRPVFSRKRRVQVKSWSSNLRIGLDNLLLCHALFGFFFQEVGRVLYPGPICQDSGNTLSWARSKMRFASSRWWRMPGSKARTH